MAVSEHESEAVDEEEAMTTQDVLDEIHEKEEVTAQDGRKFLTAEIMELTARLEKHTDYQFADTAELLDILADSARQMSVDNDEGVYDEDEISG